MKAIQYDSYGTPDVLHVAEVAEPHPGPGQVRIRVRAAAVNPFDCKVGSGAMAGGRPLGRPAGIGLEAAGIVDEVGEGVTGTHAGDPVFGFTAGPATAEFALMRIWAPQPRSMSFVQAAGLSVVSETAWRVLAESEVGPGQTVLVHGAAGGVGQATVQLARELGARVIGTASERNHDLLEQLGATPTAYGDGLVERVAALAPAGVDVVIDTAGSQLDDLLAIAGSPERVITIANYGAADRGVRVSRGGSGAADALARTAALAERGRFTLRVARTFDLDEAAEAHRLSETRSTNGKIVIVLG